MKDFLVVLIARWELVFYGVKSEKVRKCMTQLSRDVSDSLHGGLHKKDLP